MEENDFISVISKRMQSTEPQIKSNLKELANDLTSEMIVDSFIKKRNRFSKEEDERLLMIIDTYEDRNSINWNNVASKIVNRSARQCRERYMNYLLDETKKGDWSKEEDDLIVKLYRKLGPKWAEMSTHFIDRSNIDIKNRHSSISRMLNKTKTEKVQDDSQASTRIKQRKVVSKSQQKKTDTEPITDITNMTNTEIDKLFDFPDEQIQAIFRLNGRAVF